MQFNPFQEATKEELIAFIQDKGFTPGDDLEKRFNEWWYSDEQMFLFIMKFVEG